MDIKNAVFVISNTDYTKCPPADKPEYAFIGRSNVGKSTLINMLVGQNKLAKTSSNPGKTQLINHFLCNDAWYLVDLPGYGWARASKEEKGKWDVMVKDYLLYRENLYCVFVLIDVRLEPQKIDLEFIRWLGENQIPLVLVFTKADKISKNQVSQSVSRFNKQLKEDWEELPQQFVTSATTLAGKDEVLAYINQINENSK